MWFAIHAVSTALVLGSSASAAASQARKIHPLAARDNEILGSSLFPDGCLDVCIPIWRKFEACDEGDWDCFCAGNNGAEFHPCVNCLGKMDPTASGRAAGQRMLDNYSVECGDPPDTLKLAPYIPDPTAGDIPPPSKESKTPDGQSDDGADAPPAEGGSRLIILPEYLAKISVDQRAEDPDASKVEKMNEDIRQSMRIRGGAFVFSSPLWTDRYIRDLAEFEVPSQEQERRDLAVRQDQQEYGWEVLPKEDLQGVRFGIGGDAALHLVNSNTLRENFTDELTIHFNGTAMNLVSTLNCTRECGYTYTLDDGTAQSITLDSTSGSVATYSMLNLTDLADSSHVVQLKTFDAFNSLAVHYALVTVGDQAEFSAGRAFVDRDHPSVASRGWPGSLEGSEVGEGVNFAFSGATLWALGRWITDADDFTSSLSVELHNTGELFTFPLYHFQDVVKPRTPFFMAFGIRVDRGSSYDWPELTEQNVTVSVADSAIPRGSFELTGFVYEVSSKELKGDVNSADGSRPIAMKGIAVAVVGLALLCF